MFEDCAAVESILAINDGEEASDDANRVFDQGSADQGTDDKARLGFDQSGVDLDEMKKCRTADECMMSLQAAFARRGIGMTLNIERQSSGVRCCGGNPRHSVGCPVPEESLDVPRGTPEQAAMTSLCST